MNSDYETLKEVINGLYHSPYKVFFKKYREAESHI